jgi:hypothetical protein
LKKEDLILRDTTYYVYNAIAPLASRGDHFEFIRDDLGAHSAEIAESGGEGGNVYLKYVSGGSSGDSKSANYQANLYVRGIPVEDTPHTVLFIMLRHRARMPA